MFTYAYMHSQRPYPARRCGGGVVVVQTAACGIVAAQGVASGVVCGFVGGEVYLPVAHRGERARLVNDARNGVGELGRAHAVENDRRHCDLTGIRLAARFAVNAARQKIEIAVA